MSRFKDYYHLAKPGIIRGNLISCAAGFALAAKGHIDWLLLAYTLLGTSLIIGSSCVLNNLIDRDIDKKMARTKHRALVTGVITERRAVVYAASLGIIGILILASKTNWLVVTSGLIGMFFYVIVYGIAKRKTVHGTLVGSISGSIPPVAGYVAVSHRLDLAAGLLFAIMVFWQMVHFYAIAIYRLKDYQKAKIPVMPAKLGIEATRIQIILYTIAFTISGALLRIFGYTGNFYLVVIVALGLSWLGLGLRGYRSIDTTKWARQMFFYSLIVMLVFSSSLMLTGLL